MVQYEISIIIHIYSITLTFYRYDLEDKKSNGWIDLILCRFIWQDKTLYVKSFIFSYKSTEFEVNSTIWFHFLVLIISTVINRICMDNYRYFILKREHLKVCNITWCEWVTYANMTILIFCTHDLREKMIKSNNWLIYEPRRLIW